MELTALKPKTTSKVTFTNSASTASAALFAGVTGVDAVIRVYASEKCAIVISATPTATVNDTTIPTDGVEYFSLKSNEKIAVIGVAAGGYLQITEMMS